MRNLSKRPHLRAGHVALLVAATLIISVLGGSARAENPLDPVLGDPGETYPNLVPDVQDVQLIDWSPTAPPDLFFDTRAQNLGTVPVQLTVDNIESPEVSTVSQCVAWGPDRVCREQRQVGGFVWHDEHSHFHFEEFADYELRKVLRNGRVDYSRRGLIAKSSKVSFCLIDSAPVRDDAFPVGVYRTCLPTVQGISPGWTDIYDAFLEGQQLPLTGVTDGRYALVIRVNYADRLFETAYTDNTVEVMLEISDGVTDVAIVGRNYP